MSESMIVQETMIPVMLDACPSFKPTWEEFLAEWRGEEDQPLYLALSDLACHLITLVEQGETAELPAVFQVVERWHLEGDDYVSTAAKVGLLEDLQNWGLHQNGTKPEQFRVMLGPEALRSWDDLISLCHELFGEQTNQQVSKVDIPPDTA